MQGKEEDDATDIFVCWIVEEEGEGKFVEGLWFNWLSETG